MTNDRPEQSETGRTALRLIDKLLSERPVKVGHDFSEATRCVAALRDELIELCRREPSNQNRQRLVRVNSVLAVIVGAHFPLGDIPWSQMEHARSLLAVELESAA